MQAYPRGQGAASNQYQAQQWPTLNSDLEGTVAPSSNPYIDRVMAISDDAYPQVRFLQLFSRAGTQCSHA
jgi:hypothetical protein